MREGVEGRRIPLGYDSLLVLTKFPVSFGVVCCRQCSRVQRPLEEEEKEEHGG